MHDLWLDLQTALLCLWIDVKMWWTIANGWLFSKVSQVLVTILPEQLSDLYCDWACKALTDWTKDIESSC